MSRVPVRNALYVARRKRDTGGDVTEPPEDLKPVYNAIAPDPGATYGSILPFATGGEGDYRGRQTFFDPRLRWAMPSIVRDTLKGGVDLLAGTKTGTLTPEALQTFTMASPTAGYALAPRGALAAGAAKLPAAAAEREVSPVGLYSHAAETAASLPQAKGTPEQFKAMLAKQGVKPDEFKWSGYDEAFAHKPSITREELAKHFSENAPKVEETVLGGSSKAIPERYIVRNEGAWTPLIDTHTGHEVSGGTWGRMREEAQRLNAEAAGSSRLPTKFETYTLPGGENYREVLLTIPKKEGAPLPKPEPITELPEGYRVIHYSRDPRGEWGVIPPGQIHAGALNGRQYATEQEAVAGTIQHLNQTRDWQHLQAEREQAQAGMFTGSHWDQPNVLAHLRMSDRTGPNGEKVLHLEELQSDWAQQGRSKGFSGAEEKLQPNGLPEGWVVSKKTNPASGYTFWEARRGNLVAATGPSEDEVTRRALDAIRTSPSARNVDSGIPRAPYVENTSKWVDLGLKRALTEAARGGYDRLVITPGAEQAARYDLSKHIDKITLAGNNNYFKAIGKDGKVVHEGVLKDPAKELPDIVGKDVAEKLLAQEAKEPFKRIPQVSAGDLKVTPRENDWLLETPDGRRVPVGRGTAHTENDVREYGERYFNNKAREINSNRERNMGPHRELSGLDLRVGGEGMKNFYDKIVPGQLEKLAKRFDPKAKVGKDSINTGPASYEEMERRHGLQPGGFSDLDGPEQAHLMRLNKDTWRDVHSIEITPAMREAILKGLPAYAKGGRVNHAPTEAQKTAGNYAKEHISFQGLPISIENKKGSERRGVGPDGKRWRCVLPADYGYIKRTEGADGDHVDVYIGPHKDSRQVFLINQKDHRSGKFDEHKAMLGYHSEREALGDYCRAFSDGKGHARVGSVETMSLDGFKKWLKDGNTKRPADARHVINRALLLARKGVHTRNGREYRNRA